MTELHHQIRVRGPHGFHGGLPPALGGRLLEAVGASVDGAVRMAFIGRSRPQGRRHGWLQEAAAVRLRDIDPGDELVLHFTARPFGDIPELAKEMYAQTEMWPSKPARDWSAVDTLAAMIDDVAAAREDSTRFDGSLLRQLQRFGRVVGDDVQSIQVEAKHRENRRKPGFVLVDSPVLEQAQSLDDATPAPKEARVDGVLDMIRQSTRSFAIKLDSGEELRGVLLEGDVTQARALFGQRVSVQGSAIFRPSGRLLRLDGRAIVACTEKNAFWSKLPQAKSTKPTHARQPGPLGATRGVNAFFGRWAENSASDDALLDLLHTGR